MLEIKKYELLKLLDNDNIKSKELNFLRSVLEFNKYNRILVLTEKQEEWYMAIFVKYSKQEIITGSVGDKMMVIIGRNKITEIQKKHISGYGNIFRMNKNISAQLEILKKRYEI